MAVWNQGPPEACFGVCLLQLLLITKAHSPGSTPSVGVKIIVVCSAIIELCVARNIVADDDDDDEDEEPEQNGKMCLSGFSGLP